MSPSPALASGVLALALVCLPARSAHAAPPGDEPPSPALAFGVGAVMGASAIGLVTFGVFEFQRAQDHLAQCEALAMMGAQLSTACSFDPPPLAFVSAGLSWALAVPLAVGSGLAFARGATQRREQKRPPQVALAPTLQLRAGRLAHAGAQFTLRF